MNNNHCFNIWPDSVRLDFVDLLRNNLDKDAIRYQAFALGFFGFHYIRAVNDNEAVLQRESLQILKKLADASNLDASMTKQLYADEKQSYSGYWNNVLKGISLVLGDSHGSHVQYGMKLSYWLAAVYAWLYGALQRNESGQIRRAFVILESQKEILHDSAQKAQVSDKVVQKLVELTELLGNSKSNLTAHKCRKNIELVLREMLLPKECMV